MHSFTVLFILEGKIDKNIESEEYQRLLEEKKKIRDELFNIRLEMAMNKKDDKKLKELNLEVINIKHRLGKVFIKLKEYENEIEEERGMKL